MAEMVRCSRCRAELDTIYLYSQDLEWNADKQVYEYMDGGWARRVCPKCADVQVVDDVEVE